MLADRELLWLRRVRDVSLRVATEHDLSKLLPLILDAAIEITEAERGFLVLVTGTEPDGGPRIKIKAARGFDKAKLRADKGHISRTVVERVFEREGEQEGQGLVTTSDGDGDVLDASSVQARRVLSIVCVPLRLRGETRGVLYLDHRFDKGAFTEADLPVLRTFASQAALAVETAELRAGVKETDALRKNLEELEELEMLRTVSEPMVTDPAPARRVRFGALVGVSDAMARLYAEIERISRTWDPVLILGESGTGKELVAREIHARSARAREPFLSESCSAFAEGLLESELFGHEKGAFTGATSGRAGLFREAGEGTLFLDEVGEMSPALQAKLLRVLQEQRVRPVGGDRSVPISCRILAATHRDLRTLVAEGRFREDLYYRLDVIRITVPPLRDRRSDVKLLLAHFAPDLEPSPKALELLTRYSWPGNVRELENEARRLATLEDQRVSGQHLSAEIREGRGVARGQGVTAGKTLAEVERHMVEAALRDCDGNKAQTARQLGIPRSTLYNLISRYGL